MPRIKGQRGGGIYGPATIDRKAYLDGQKKVSAKRAIALVYKWIGGAEEMAKWAKENPTDFYTKMFVKLLPIEVKGQINHTAKTSVHQFSKAELEAIAARGVEDIAVQIGSDGKPH